MSFLKVNGYLPEGEMRLGTEPVRSDTERGLVSGLNRVWCRDLVKTAFFQGRETTFPACCQDVVRRDSLAIPGLACRVGGMTFPA